MDMTSPGILSLRKKVTAATHEFNVAIALHHNWEICVSDGDLHTRLSHSYAYGAFIVIRQALRRELLLALTRMWDKNKKSLSMIGVANLLRDKRLQDALVTDYANQWGRTDPDGLNVLQEGETELVRLAFRHSERQHGLERGEVLRAQANRAIDIIAAFEGGGSRIETLDYLRTLRDQHLAHHQINPDEVDVEQKAVGDGDVENFYYDMYELIRLVNAVAHGADYRPEETSAMHLRHATFFWRGVRGERTEGHPDYIPLR